MKKKVICTMMILILTITPCYRVYADAGTITIAGGTIGVGGVAGGALAGLAGPAVVAVFCGMLAVGIDLELTEQSQQAGMTKTQFVKSKIDQYCEEAGKTADVFYKGITNGTSVLKDGTLAFTDATALQIKQFINWLFDSNQVSQPSQGSEGTVTLGGLNMPILNQGDSIYLYTRGGVENNLSFIQGNGTIAVFNTVASAGSNSLWWFLVSNTNDPAKLRFVQQGETNLGWSGPVNGYYYYGIGNYIASDKNNDIPTYVGYNGNNIRDLFRSFDGTWNPGMSGAGASDGFTGTRDTWNERSGVFDPAQGYPTVVNPGLIGQIPLPADKDITTNVQDYLDALQDILDGIQDRVIEGVDQADGIPKDWDIPDTVAIDPTIGKHPPIPDTDRTPISNENPPNPATNPTIASEPLKFNLTEIFPFCIPFDIKDMIGLLEAEPVAPTYTVNWNIPIVNVPLNFTVDLSPWSSVAIICRRMELLIFIIGLAMITRDLIRG